MVYYDSHVHTAFSTDSDTQMEQMVLQGIQNGLHGLTFTDHMDYHFPQNGNWDAGESHPPFTFDLDAYFPQVKKLQEKYKDTIQIYCGVEIGMKEDAYGENVLLSQREQLDYCIGSTHLVHDMDPYDRQYWDAYDEKAGIEIYFEETLKNLKAKDIHIDTLGHLDYIVRYSPSGYRMYSYQMFADIIDEILRLIIDREISLEVNTAGYKNGGPMPNPNEDIIRRYRELGGERITFGSDAHETEQLCSRFHDAETIVRNAGFDYYVTFVHHKPVFHTWH